MLRRALLSSLVALLLAFPVVARAQIGDAFTYATLGVIDHGKTFPGIAGLVSF